MDDRFDLIVPRVSERHRIGPPSAGGVFEELVPEGPRRLLDPPFQFPGLGGAVSGAVEEWNAERSNVSFDDSTFPGRPFPDAVIEVRRGERKGELTGKLVEYGEERHGVRTARDGGDDPGAGFD